jgi:hypothetical protein
MHPTRDGHSGASARWRYTRTMSLRTVGGRSLLVAVLFLAAVIGVATRSAWASLPPSDPFVGDMAFGYAPTQRVSIQLFAGDSVASGYHVVSFARGQCPTTGDAHRRDALRCFAGNLVIDPCFRAPNGDDVGFALCLTGSPFGKRLLRVTLTEPLPYMQQHPQSGAEYPFAVQLVSDRTCSIATGALGVVAGKVPFYYCGGNGALGGHVHEAGSHWWAWFASSFTHPRWVKVGVRLAAF